MLVLTSTKILISTKSKMKGEEMDKTTSFKVFRIFGIEVRVTIAGL